MTPALPAVPTHAPTQAPHPEVILLPTAAIVSVLALLAPFVVGLVNQSYLAHVGPPVAALRRLCGHRVLLVGRERPDRGRLGELGPQHGRTVGRRVPARVRRRQARHKLVFENTVKRYPTLQSSLDRSLIA